MKVYENIQLHFLRCTIYQRRKHEVVFLFSCFWARKFGFKLNAIYVPPALLQMMNSLVVYLFFGFHQLLVSRQQQIEGQGTTRIWRRLVLFLRRGDGRGWRCAPFWMRNMSCCFIPLHGYALPCDQKYNPPRFSFFPTTTIFCIFCSPLLLNGFTKGMLYQVTFFVETVTT